MPKKFMRSVMRRGHKAVAAPRIRHLFGDKLHDPNLWHLNRHSVSWAFAIGVFMSFMPFPSQMLISAAVAVAVGCNLPIAVATVWISNPITIPPIFYGCYRFGAWLIGTPVHDIKFELTLEWFMHKLSDVWEPLLVGCMTIGLTSGLIAFFGIRLLWRLRVAQSWRDRKKRRSLLRATDPRRSSATAEHPPKL